MHCLLYRKLKGKITYLDDRVFYFLSVSLLFPIGLKDTLCFLIFLSFYSKSSHCILVFLVFLFDFQNGFVIFAPLPHFLNRSSHFLGVVIECMIFYRSLLVIDASMWYYVVKGTLPINETFLDWLWNFFNNSFFYVDPF